ncbi:unnamed protein product [Urochloa humidicola]
MRASSWPPRCGPSARRGRRKPNSARRVSLPGDDGDFSWMFKLHPLSSLLGSMFCDTPATTSSSMCSTECMNGPIEILGTAGRRAPCHAPLCIAMRQDVFAP